MLNVILYSTHTGGRVHCHYTDSKRSILFVWLQKWLRIRREKKCQETQSKMARPYWQLRYHFKSCHRSQHKNIIHYRYRNDLRTITTPAFTKIDTFCHSLPYRTTFFFGYNICGNDISAIREAVMDFSSAPACQVSRRCVLFVPDKWQLLISFSGLGRRIYLKTDKRETLCMSINMTLFLRYDTTPPSRSCKFS